jgi:hypothetical protein
METGSLGEKTFFWYRVYVGVMALLYMAVAIMGVAFLLIPFETRQYERGEIMLMGGVYAALGAVFFIAFAVALFLPPKPYNWIVGIIMIALGLTSCCLLPATIPLLIYWIKPETQAFFGRKSSS